MDVRGTLMPDPDLIRFLDAQDQIYAQIVDELTKGRKQTHWMWFVFPQLVGLGRSATAQHYAIRGLNQARCYLDDPVLGARLRQVVNFDDPSEGKIGFGDSWFSRRPKVSILSDVVS
jgi:uncharacterized protein (DUF1810 family)